MIAILILVFAANVANATSQYRYHCYSGSFKQTKFKQFSEIYIGIPVSMENPASRMIVYDAKSRMYSTDLFCKKIPGRCAILDDGGNIDIIAKSAKVLKIKLKGKPYIADRGNGHEFAPALSQGSSVPMTLKSRPSADCEKECTHCEKKASH